MTTKDTVKKIWTECFDDTPQWIEMFFSEVYRDEDAVTLSHDGLTVSSLMLQRYAMNFHGSVIPAGYICGAATLPQCREKGYMTRLLHDALHKCDERGDMICTLIPAGEALFRLYRHAGFSPAFYINLERYTSAHTFSHTKEYTQSRAIDTDENYALFSDLMMRRPCCVQHDRTRWHQIIMDNSIDGGTPIILVDSYGNGCAIAFTVPTDDDSVRITDLLAKDADSRLGALAVVREIYGNLPIEVYGYFDAPAGIETPRGSVRIVDVYRLLQLLADAYPELKANIKVNDGIITRNSHIYVIERGSVLINDGFRGTLDYDIDIEVLASIVFGNDVTRRLLGFPATRPFISLMLD